VVERAQYRDESAVAHDAAGYELVAPGR
jgi:hypothetical protein